jgi:DNA-binding LacI/PurR family transcriptional regulator
MPLSINWQSTPEKIIMVHCVHCNEVSGIAKAGKQSNKQRYFCKYCIKHFTVQSSAPGLSRKRECITIKDLSKKLGYSISTISRAMNDSPEIKEKTKRYIIAEAESMGFQRNLNAVSLVKKQSFNIGIVVPELHSDFYSNLIGGANKVLKASGYRVYIMQSEESYDTEASNMDSLIESRVDGIIASTTFQTRDFAHFQKALQKNIPVVFFSRINNELKCPKIAVDNYAGGCLATEHLVKQGYDRIGYLGGAADFHIGRLRYQGFLDTLIRYKKDCKEELILKDDRLVREPGQLIRRYLMSNGRADAVFAMTDTIGIEVIRTARDIGIDIPHELGVIGFSDSLVSRYLSPGLSSIRQPTDEIGIQAAKTLVDLIEGNDHGKSEADNTSLLKPVLIMRESTRRFL